MWKTPVVVLQSVFIFHLLRRRVIYISWGIYLAVCWIFPYCTIIATFLVLVSSILHATCIPLVNSTPAVICQSSLWCIYLLVFLSCLSETFAAVRFGWAHYYIMLLLNAFLMLTVDYKWLQFYLPPDIHVGSILPCFQPSTTKCDKLGFIEGSHLCDSQ